VALGKRKGRGRPPFSFIIIESGGKEGRKARANYYSLSLGVRIKEGDFKLLLYGGDKKEGEELVFH